MIVYAEIGRNGFGCWNTRLPFSEQNHDSIDQNAETMFYPGDLTVSNPYLRRQSLKLILIFDNNTD